METIGLIGFRKVVEDFAAVCKTIKQELANPDIASGIKDEVVKLGNQMDAQLDGLGETLKPLMEADIEKAAKTTEAIADMESEGAPASNVIEMPNRGMGSAPKTVKAKGRTPDEIFSNATAEAAADLETQRALIGMVQGTR